MRPEVKICSVWASAGAHTAIQEIEKSRGVVIDGGGKVVTE